MRFLSVSSRHSSGRPAHDVPADPSGAWLHRDPWRVRTLIIATGVVSLLCGLWMIAARDRSTTARNALQVPENALRFGTVWADSTFSWTIPIKNVSHSQVGVESISTSCGCTVAHVGAFSLKPGETRKVPLILDLVENAQQTDSLREFSVNIFVAVSAESQASRTQQWTLSGNVRDLLEISPNELAAREIVVGRQSEHLQRMHVKSRVPLLDLDVQTPVGYGATVTSCADEHTVELLLPTVASAGRHEDTITLVAKTTDATIVRIAVPVRYRVVEEIGFVPDLDHLGAIPVDTKHSAVRQFRSYTGRQFRVVSVGVGDQNGVIATADYNQDELTLTCQPVRTGSCSFEIMVTWDVESTSAEWESVRGRFLFQCVGVQH